MALESTDRNPFVTFVIPTLNRPSLERTAESLMRQTDQDFDVIIVTDKCTVAPVVMKVLGCKLRSIMEFDRQNEQFDPQLYHCGLMREQGYRQARGVWVANVDDDDSVNEHYVEWLKQEAFNSDLVLFRLSFPDGSVRPAYGVIPLTAFNVSNGFSVRKEFVLSNNIHYIVSTTTDWPFIDECRRSGARIDISNRVAYYFQH